MAKYKNQHGVLIECGTCTWFEENKGNGIYALDGLCRVSSPDQDSDVQAGVSKNDWCRFWDSEKRLLESTGWTRVKEKERSQDGK